MTTDHDVAPRRPIAGAQRGWLLVALVLGVFAALRYVIVFARNDAYGIGKYYLADDSFYYFQTARNFAAGLGSTFDGVHVTNGYHPLWFLVSAGVFAIVHGATAPLLVLLLLQVAMLFASTMLLFLALRELDPVPAAFTAALFLASNYSRVILFAGMESAPAFLFASGLLVIALRRRTRFFLPATGREALGTFALLLGLVFSRLEAGILAAAWLVIAWTLVVRQGGASRARIALVTLGLAAAGCAYVTVNLRLVGVPVPLSGLIKAGGRPTAAWIAQVFAKHCDAFAGLLALPNSNHLRLAAQLNPVIAIVLVLALAAFLVQLGRRRPDTALALVPFLLFSCVFVAVSSLVTGGIYHWYLWPALLSGVLATFALLHFLLAAVRSARPALAAVALVTAASTAVGWVPVLHTRTLADWGLQGFVMDSTIRFVREQIPADENVGAISSGLFTYFSGRQLENLEGLANGVDFFRARGNPVTYGEYLRKNRIRWIVFYATTATERERWMNQFRAIAAIDRVYDLDSFYHLDLRRAHPGLEEPNVYFVRLKS